SGGRVVAGVGLGWLEAESQLMGVEHAKRARIADDALAVMRACWSGDTAEFHFAPRPHADRHLPLLVGGASKAALRRAARLGDGHLVFEFPVSRGEESMYLFETLAAIREDAGV